MNSRFVRHIGFTLAVGVVVLASRLALQAIPTQQVGEWAAMGPMADSRTGAASVALPDGRTVIVGGLLADGTATDSVVIVNPADNSVTPAGQLSSPRTGHTATLLEDGRVLVAGGTSSGAIIGDIDIVDLVAGTTTPVAFLLQPRTGHAAARLADGQVLIVGGTTVDGAVLANAERVDVEAPSVTFLTSSMATARTGASATTLIDGRVLVAGGNDGTADLATAELFYPYDQTFGPTDTSLSVARSGHTALLLANNNAVLIAGGTAGGSAVTTTDWFLPAMFPDPYSWSMGTFAATGSMAEARSQAMTGPFGEGYAFVSGGGSSNAEKYKFATIKTDKDDYAPYEPAVITGSGWAANEDVTLVFQEDPAVHEDYVLTVTADGEGNFRYTDWTPEQHDLGVRFYLMATGAQSGSLAQTTFTDSYSSASATLTSGAQANVSVVYVQPSAAVSARVNVTVTSNSGGGAPTVWYATSWKIGAGSVTCVNHADYTGTGGSGTPFSETFSIGNAPGSAGTYNVVFIAYPTNDCTGSGTTITLTGGIVVDTTNPTITLDAPAAAATLSGNFKFQTTPVDTNMAYVEYWVDSALVDTISANPWDTGNVNYDSAPGSHTWYAKAYDKAGNSVTSGSRTFTIGAANAAPVASAVSISGTANYGQLLTGSYTYSDADGDLQGTSTFRWLRNGTTVVGTSLTYTAVGADVGQTLTFEVTPVAATGTSPGSPVTSLGVLIGKATLTVTASSPSVTYGDPVPTIDPIYGTFLGSDDATDIDTPPTCSTAYTTTSAAGSNPTTSCTGGSDNNYSFSFVAGSVTVGQATSTVTVTCTAGAPYAYTGVAQTPCTAEATGAGMTAVDVTASLVYTDNTNAGPATADASWAGDANHTGNTGSGGFTIGQATLTVTASSPSVTYGDPVPTIDPIYGTFLGSDDATDIDTPPTCSTAYTTASAAGSNPATSCSGGSDNNYSFSFVAGSVTVGQATSETTVTCPAGPYTYTGAAQTPCTVTVTGAGGLNETPAPTYLNNVNAGLATASYTFAGDANHTGSSNSANFTIGKATANCVVVPYNVVYDTLPHTATGSCTGVDAGGAALGGTLNFAGTVHTLAGVYSTDSWTFSGGTNYFNIGPVTITDVISPRAALVNYIGQLLFVTSGTSSTTAQVTLTASVQDPTGLALAGATMSFIDTTTNKVLASGVPVSPVAGSAGNTGTANKIVTLSTGQYGAESYTIRVVMTGNYDNSAQTADDKTAVITVTKPAATNETTGGGTIVGDPASAGLYRSLDDEPVTYTVGMKYNKSRTSLQGKITLAIPQADGSIVYVKSNSISSMAISGTNPKKSTIYAKASLYRDDGGVLTTIDGGVTLRLDGEDLTSFPDKIGFTVLSSKTSQLYYSSNWVLDAAAWKTVVQAISTGSLQIK